MEPLQFKDTEKPLNYPNYDYPDFEPIFDPETATSDTETDDELKGGPPKRNWKTQIFTNRDDLKSVKGFRASYNATKK